MPSKIQPLTKKEALELLNQDWLQNPPYFEEDLQSPKKQEKCPENGSNSFKTTKLRDIRPLEEETC